MKYLRLFENFDSYDPYELMILPPNIKAEMLIQEIKKSKPNLELIELLITLGANLDWQDEDDYNRTALYYAAGWNYLEIVKMLIDAGADLDIQDEYDMTALHRAAISNRPKIARMLLDAGAKLDIRNNNGFTALHYAAYWNRPEITQMLVDAGAKLDIQDNEGLTPYELARTEEMKNILQP